MEKASLFAMLSTLALLVSATGCAGSKSAAKPVGPSLGSPMGTPTAKDAKPSGFGKMVSSRKSAVKPTAELAKDDPLSLANRSEPDAALYVVMAQTHERSGNFKAAADQYERALSKDPTSLDAALGFARMVDREGDFPKANRLYEQALQRHPQSATVRNDYGLCLARQGEMGRAAGMLQTACQLEPQDVRYRNNLATVLVESKQFEEAYLQLADVHEPAVAYYNVGYLLAQRNEYEAARHHFEQALKLKPGMAEATQWLGMLPSSAAGSHLARQAPQGQSYGESTSLRYGNLQQ